MISDQERFDAWIPISNQMTDIAARTIQNRFFWNEMGARMNQSPDGFSIMKPAINENGLPGFISIHHSSPATASMKNLKFYPYFKEDIDLNSDLQHFANPAISGGYFPEHHMILINMSSGETARYLGHCAIHELGHALFAKRRNAILTSDEVPHEIRVAEEMENRTFDYRLLLEIGGAKYRALADDMAFKIMRHRTRQQKNMPLIRGRGIALDYCWGSVHEEEHKKMRDDLFCLYCELMAIDRYLPPDLASKEKCLQVASLTGLKL